MRKPAATPGQLIDRLGGTNAVLELTGAGGRSAVSNWRSRGIPAWAIPSVKRAADLRGLTVDPAVLEPRRYRRKSANTG